MQSNYLLKFPFNAYPVALWVKISAEDILKYFSYFSHKTGQHFMQIVLSADNLHKMSNPVLWEK